MRTAGSEGEYFWPSRRRGRRRALILAALALGNLAVLGTDVFLLTQRNVTRAVSLDSALRQFRGSVSAAAVPVIAPGTTGVSTTSVASSSSSSSSSGGSSGPAPVPTSPRTGAAVIAASSGGPAASPVVASPVAFTLPLAGVYAYKTSGGEQINILNSSHSYPATTYATVRHEGGCNWQIENQVIQEHTDRRNLCSTPGALFQLDQSRYITFFGQTDGMDYTCAPRMEAVSVSEVGATRDAVCADATGDAAHIHETDLGLTNVTVGGVTVTAYHVMLDSVLSGRAVGRSHDDMLILATSGLTISWHRSVDTLANAAFGAKAHYTEHAAFDLISLTPQT